VDNTNREMITSSCEGYLHKCTNKEADGIQQRVNGLVTLMKRIVKIAWDRLLTWFMPVLAVARLLLPLCNSWPTSV